MERRQRLWCGEWGNTVEGGGFSFPVFTAVHDALPPPLPLDNDRENWNKAGRPVKKKKKKCTFFETRMKLRTNARARVLLLGRAIEDIHRRWIQNPLDRFVPRWIYLRGKGGRGDGLRDSFHRYGDFSFYLCKLLGFNKRITFCCVALTQKRRLNSLAEKSALREIVDSRLMKLRRMIMRFSIIVVEHDRWFNRRRIDNFPLPTSCTIITSCSTNFRTLDNFERESISLC